MVRGTKFNTKSSPTFETLSVNGRVFLCPRNFDKVVKTKHCVSHRPTINLEFGVQENIVSHCHTRSWFGNTCETIRNTSSGGVGNTQNSFTKN